MTICLKCWNEAARRVDFDNCKSQTDHYMDILKEKEDRGEVCTEEEQKTGRSEEIGIYKGEKKGQDEAELLALCGLKHSDFVRFRGVYREGGELVVKTRENGVNMRSVNALRNPNYVRSVTDDFDSTFEYYHFAIPMEAEHE